MPRSVRLRPWQRAALERLDAAPGADFLAVATPGAGKTTFALAAARRHLAEHPRRRLVVVAPTASLKSQWARAAAALDLHLETEWRAADGALPADVHGLVTTYQQVAASAPRLRGLAAGAFVVFDEVHHAADDRAWGDAVRVAFGPAARRLSLSGTPFRSDTHAIPFVRYVADEAVADFEYGYDDALRDGRVVRPVHFPRTDGRMEWAAPGDGASQSATFADPLDAARAGHRLRTALSLEGEWLPAVLRRAHQRLLEVRRAHADAGGLVIATDQEHARGVAALLRDRIGTPAAVVTSDDPTASARIARFAAEATPWIVAVRMVSEGVDVPRLRVGVLATTTTTELFFRQAVGRLVRWTPGTGRQPSFMFIPDDPRLRAWAFQIADQRRHSLRKRERAERPAEPADPAAADDDPAGEAQLSLFAAISAVPLGEAGAPAWGTDDGADHDGDGDGDELLVALPPAPPLAGGRTTAAPGAAVVPTRQEHKERLRADNAERARDIARRAGLGHAAVNAELNRLAGVRRVTEATLEQLERRLRHADAWARRL